MTERSTLQTKKSLDRILAGAQAAGDLGGLYWFAEMRVSPSLSGHKQHIIAACAYPIGWVPVVPVGEDPATSRHYAEALLECLKTGNRGRLLEFGLALTNREIVESGFQIYEWGEMRWDCICVECGAVWQSTTAHEELCGGCHDRTTANRRTDGRTEPVQAKAATDAGAAMATATETGPATMLADSMEGGSNGC